jgi:hypothetical protein
MSMPEWARSALPYTSQVPPITKKLSELADAHDPPALQAFASRLIDLMNEIEHRVPDPPDPNCALLWQGWIHCMQLSGMEFIRGVSVTHKLQPAADYAREGTEQLNALVALIEAMASRNPSFGQKI